MQTRRYTNGAIALHWLIATLIVLNFIAIWYAGQVQGAARAQVMANHRAFGITVLVLSVVRILWRLTHRAPPLEPELKRWEVALARLVHTLFYVLIVAVPLTGWMMSTAHGFGPVRWFGLFSIPQPPVPVDHGVAETLEGVHGNLAFLMLALIALHVAGALKHQFVDRDATLGRMVPWPRRP